MKTNSGSQHFSEYSNRKTQETEQPLIGRRDQSPNRTNTRQYSLKQTNQRNKKQVLLNKSMKKPGNRQAYKLGKTKTKTQTNQS